MRENNVFKVQMPLASNQPNAPALIYNHDRTVERFIEVDAALLTAMKSAEKKFFYGHIDLNTRHVVIEGEAPWQSW